MSANRLVTSALVSPPAAEEFQLRLAPTQLRPLLHGSDRLVSPNAPYVVVTHTGGGKTANFVGLWLAAARASSWVERELSIFATRMLNSRVEITQRYARQGGLITSPGTEGVAAEPTGTTLPTWLRVTTAAEPTGAIVPAWLRMVPGSRASLYEEPSPVLRAAVLLLSVLKAALEQFLVWVDRAIASVLCDARYPYIGAVPLTGVSPCGRLRRGVPQEPRAPGGSCVLRTPTDPAPATA